MTLYTVQIATRRVTLPAEDALNAAYLAAARLGLPATYAHLHAEPGCWNLYALDTYLALAHVQEIR